MRSVQYRLATKFIVFNNQFTVRVIGCIKFKLVSIRFRKFLQPISIRRVFGIIAVNDNGGLLGYLNIGLLLAELSIAEHYSQAKSLLASCLALFRGRVRLLSNKESTTS